MKITEGEVHEYYVRYAELTYEQETFISHTARKEGRTVDFNGECLRIGGFTTQVALRIFTKGIAKEFAE